MSLFLGGSFGLEADPEKIRLARLEFESYVALYTNMLEGCRQKCFPKYYTEEELNKGEMCCVDRCVSKFFQANRSIGRLLAEGGADPSRLPSYRAALSGTGSLQHLNTSGVQQ